jgi:spermidine synthase
LSPSLRRYLYFTAAVTGAAIMFVEILGAKMLAPYVGTSHFVWTAQIAITLVALAAGYYAGGWWVDRSPRLGRLYACVLVSAVYLCVTVLVVEPIAYWCLKARLAVGTLLASTFLFFVPLALLAMVGPFVIRVLTVSVSGVGRNVGRLYAVSTLGSFLGTLLIGYALIPFLPNSSSMHLTAALLTLLALGYYFVWARSAGAVAATGGALLVAALASWGVYLEAQPRYERFEELAQRNSEFGLLQVLQEKNSARRVYLNDYLTQNTYDSEQKKSLSMFTYMLHELALLYTERIDTVLCIGMGVGIVPMEFARAGAQVDVVEINPAVVPLAREYFDCEPERLNLFLGDGRYFLNQCSKQYDAVILDAFLGDSSPSHLLSREAFAAVRRVLRPQGVLVINCFGDFDLGKDFFVASLEKTLKAVFPSVRIHNERNGGNVFFVASPSPKLEIMRPPDLERVHASERAKVRTALDRIVETNPLSGLVLTDNYNPVEYYDAANRETLRRYLATAMREN